QLLTVADDAVDGPLRAYFPHEADPEVGDGVAADVRPSGSRREVVRAVSAQHGGEALAAGRVAGCEVRFDGGDHRLPTGLVDGGHASSSGSAAVGLGASVSRGGSPVGEEVAPGGVREAAASSSSLTKSRCSRIAAAARSGSRSATAASTFRWPSLALRAAPGSRAPVRLTSSRRSIKGASSTSYSGLSLAWASS